MNSDWKQITSNAYMTLIENKVCTFPICVENIEFEDIVILSFEEYSNIANCSISDLTCGHELDDAYVVPNIRPDIHLILYNADKYDRRVRHTLWHEIGHIKCGHKKHGSQEEIEAHFFASQCNAPNILIKELNKRGYKPSVDSLMNHFGLSRESAKKKMDYLGQHSFNHTNPYDDTLSLIFHSFLEEEYPSLTKQIYDDYFDEMEREREQWQ